MNAVTDSELEAIDEAVRAPVGARPPKLRYTHQGMCDLLIQHPMISQNELAALFGYTPSWISTIITSDAFQSLLAQRRAEIVNPEIALTLHERYNALATKSLQVLQAKISKPADQVSDALALKTAELAAKALGIGGNGPPVVQVDPASYLPELANRLMRLQGGRGASDAVILNESA